MLHFGDSKLYVKKQLVNMPFAPFPAEKDKG